MKWIDPEKKRPKVAQKIITESAVGLFWGTFTTNRNGSVLVEDKSFDEIEWEDIYRWIPYPEDNE